MTRVIAGSAGGRRLRTPPGTATRPTSDRVREALFSTLESQLGTLGGHSVLDLYAGSGAVAIEAASRGATRVRAVESDRRTARLVRGNATSLGLAVEVVAEPASRALGHRADDSFDVVFADPPYSLDGDDLVAVLALLVAHGWIADGSHVVVERSARSVEPVWPAGLVCDRVKEYGETVLWYLRAELADR